jgi:6-phosphogluconolactonase
VAPDVVQRVFEDPAALAFGAAQLISDSLGRAIVERGRASFVLAGGGTPQATYRALADSSLDWSSVDLFQGDERCVPPDAPASNYRMVRETLLDPSSVPPANVWRIEGEKEPSEAASAYERRLRERFAGADLPRFDLVLLGIGTDGHVASLFPGWSSTPDRWVAAVEPPSPGPKRVTLELAPLAAARTVCLLVSGAHKAAIVDRVRSGAGDDLPAAAVVARAEAAIWLLDRAAATGVV